MIRRDVRVGVKNPIPVRHRRAGGGGRGLLFLTIKLMLFVVVVVNYHLSGYADFASEYVWNNIITRTGNVILHVHVLAVTAQVYGFT